MAIPLAEGDNPFAGYGTEVSEARFVGREYELSQLYARLCGSLDFSSVAIVGLPRMGKTSLAKALLRRTTSTSHFRVALATCDVGSYRSPDDFFYSLAVQLVEDCRARGLSSQQVEYFARSIQGPPEFRFDELRPLLVALRSAGIRCFCVVDEFDAGRRLFEGNSQVFHQLRDLASNGAHKLGLILVSKRRLGDVSRLAGVDSRYWSNTLSVLPLHVFSREETEVVFARLQQSGEEVGEELTKLVNYWCGGQPFLLEAFAFHLYADRKAGRITDRSWFERTVWPVVAEYYQQVYEVLESSDMHHKVAQALLGPNEDLEPAESIGLVHYGVIIEGEGEILPFVPGFSWFLRQKVQSANLWMMWTSVESELRDRIHERLVSRFGSPNWLSAFCAAHPSLRSALIDADERYQKDSLTVREPCGLLAFTYPKDLFRMLLADWSSLGQPILGASRRYWEDRLELLARVRTPMAHSRERAIRSSDRDFARSILGEISGRLRGVSTDD